MCAVLLLTTGCIRRSLTVRTDPPGAMVYVNDQLKGASPVTYDFRWYGWHRVMLRKNGFERVEDRQLLRAPVYFWIPLDLAMELLPFPIRDARTWAYTLNPTPVPPSPVPPEITPQKTEVLQPSESTSQPPGAGEAPNPSPPSPVPTTAEQEGAKQMGSEPPAGAAAQPPGETPTPPAERPSDESR